MSNNPPAAVLELSKEQAEFLLDNCEKNISLGLALIMGGGDRATLERIVLMNEHFKELRTMLRRQGVRVDGD